MFFKDFVYDLVVVSNIFCFSPFFTPSYLKNNKSGFTPYESKSKLNGRFLGGGFKYVLFSPLFGEDFPFD